MAREAKPRWHKTANLWYANIGPRGPDGRRSEVYAPVTIRQQDEVQKWAWFQTAKDEQARRETPVPTDRLTVADLGGRYLARCKALAEEGGISAAHYRAKTHHVGHFAAALGGNTARSLTPRIMDGFVARIRPNFKPNYLANICATVSALFNWGVKEGLIEVNPVRGFEAPVVPDAPERFATRGEAAAWLEFLWRRADPRLASCRFARNHALMQRMLIHTGARPGELCVLTWADIKWHGWTARGGHVAARVTIPPDRWKTGSITGKPRTIYIPPLLSRALRRLKARGDGHPTHVFIHGRGQGGVGAGQPWADGSTLAATVRRLRRELIAERTAGPVGARARRLAAVPILDDGDNRLVNYRWRHTAASTLLMHGVDVPTVGKLLGTSAEMIYRTYGHLLDEHLTEAAAKLTGRKKIKAGA